MTKRLTTEDLIWIDELFENLTVDDALNGAGPSERPTQGKGANAGITGNGVYFMLGEAFMLVSSKSIRTA